MAEWFKAAVLKCADRRIGPSPSVPRDADLLAFLRLAMTVATPCPGWSFGVRCQFGCHAAKQTARRLSGPLCSGKRVARGSSSGGEWPAGSGRGYAGDGLSAECGLVRVLAAGALEGNIVISRSPRHSWQNSGRQTVSNVIPGPPPTSAQLVVAIHNLQIQITCLEAAFGILASDARPEIVNAAATAVRSCTATIRSPFYPGEEGALGMTKSAQEIADKIATLIAGSA